ncbi:hypothetical protein V6N11_033326 [Hibiscus sabdariffa]|uniref:Polyprotein n=1 Tax=Hibiscus sabdariffa TaxID=183260 RepID=A0ABR2PXR0_9ROSI
MGERLKISLYERSNKKPTWLSKKYATEKGSSKTIYQEARKLTEHVKTLDFRSNARKKEIVGANEKKSVSGENTNDALSIGEEDGVESIFSIDDEPNDNSLFAIQSLEDNHKESDSEWSSKGIFMLQNQISPLAPIASVIPAPHISVSIYLSKYNKPIEVIAFMDTGATKTIMNPDILPSEWWKPHTRIFSTASNEEFATHLISKPITIQFFPGCAVRTTVLGSRLPGKDLVIGFDTYTRENFLRIVPDGLKYKQMFKPFVEIPRLFLVEPTEKITGILNELKAKSCAESHEDFLSKCDHPLWKNPEFFIKLPFKKNEDVNPTKAKPHRDEPRTPEAGRSRMH